MNTSPNQDPANLVSPVQVRHLLQRMAFTPSKSLGQNFLVDGNLLRLLVEEAAITAEDHVLEIGPGLGVLTRALCAAAGKVTAIEKDRRLFSFLQEDLADRPNLHLVCGDVLDQDFEALAASGITRLAANLPYAAGTRAVVSLAGTTHAPARMVFTVQKDVAERLASPPGVSSYGTVSVLVQSRYEVHLVRDIPPSCFVPRPRVQSSIVSCVKRPEPLDHDLDRTRFESLVKGIFTERRKQLGGLLQRKFGIDFPTLGKFPAALGITPDQRPEKLSVEQWCGLAAAVQRRQD